MRDNLIGGTVMKQRILSNGVMQVKKSYSFVKDIKKNYVLYLFLLPALLYYVIFSYIPMIGSLMAFQNYHPADGILGSEWVGFKHFYDFFKNYYFWNVTRNTFCISALSILFGFPAPIIFALLLNEIYNTKFKSVVQTITYIPHFISMVVICGMIKSFVSDTGVIGMAISILTGKEPVNLLNYAENFRAIYIISDIWQDVGWGSIIYLAALSGVDVALYDAAKIDGAGKFRLVLHVTLPSIVPTIVIMFILRMGTILSVGFEKIILLYNPMTYEKADVISSFVYRKGLVDMNWSYSSAIGLLNSVVNFIFVFATNCISRKFNETSLW